MANPEQVEMLLRDGVAAWNQWRKENRGVRPDLSEADLRGADLTEADLHWTNLSGADLRRADLHRADLRVADLHRVDLCETNLREANLIGDKLNWVNLRKADLSGARLAAADLSSADLFQANLSGANLGKANLRKARLSWANLFQAGLRKANLSEAKLHWANLAWADLSSANLSNADLTQATFTGARLFGATLRGCTVCGISTWEAQLHSAAQADLRIAHPWQPLITVDNLKVAQFLDLLMHNQEMRAVLDTVTSKVVLILGRFNSERKPIVDALREALRRHPNSYIPVLFDCERQRGKPVLRTTKTLASLARFIIADLTDPNIDWSVLTYFTASLPTVPVQPILQAGASLPTEYATWQEYRSFLPIYEYADQSQLLASLNESVITPVEGYVQARRL